MEKKMVMMRKVLSCLVVFLILMSAMPVLVLASNSSNNVTGRDGICLEDSNHNSISNDTYADLNGDGTIQKDELIDLSLPAVDVLEAKPEGSTPGLRKLETPSGAVITIEEDDIISLDTLSSPWGIDSFFKDRLMDISEGKASWYYDQVEGVAPGEYTDWRFDEAGVKDAVELVYIDLSLEVDEPLYSAVDYPAGDPIFDPSICVTEEDWKRVALHNPYEATRELALTHITDKEWIEGYNHPNCWFIVYRLGGEIVGVEGYGKIEKRYLKDVVKPGVDYQITISSGYAEIKTFNTYDLDSEKFAVVPIGNLTEEQYSYAEVGMIEKYYLKTVTEVKDFGGVPESLQWTFFACLRIIKENGVTSLQGRLEAVFLKDVVKVSKDGKAEYKYCKGLTIVKEDGEETITGRIERKH